MKTLQTIIFIVLTSSLFSQAIIDFGAAAGALKIPVKETSSISSATDGMIVFQSSNSTIYRYSSIGGWTRLSAKEIKDSDGDSHLSFIGDISYLTQEDTLRIKIDRGRIEQLNNGESVFIGEYAGAKDTRNSGRNVFVGNTAGSRNTTGFNNVFLGESAGAFNIGGDRNIFIGRWAGINNEASNDNLFIGNSAGNQHIAMSNNVFIGNDAGGSHKEGTENVIIGNQAFSRDTTSWRNTVVGHGAFTSVGINTKSNNQNTALGYQCLKSLTNGFGNTAIGSKAMWLSNTASENVMIGINAGDNFNGNRSVMIGFQAGATAVPSTTSNSVFIGSKSGKNETSANRLHIANTDTESLIYGEFDNQLVRINGELQGYGKTVFNPETTTRDIIVENILDPIALFGAQDNPIIRPSEDGWGFVGSPSHEFYAMFSNQFFANEVLISSDFKLKNNIRKIDDALPSILNLEPVLYQYKKDPNGGLHTGFIAQEVQIIYPHLVSNRGNGELAINYIELIPLMTKSLKDQQELIESQQKELNTLKQQMKTIIELAGK